MFMGWKSYADVQLGLWISANSVGNIITAKSLRKRRKQFANGQNMSRTLRLSCMGYSSIIIHLLFYLP